MGNCFTHEKELPQEWSYLNRNFNEIAFRVEVNFDQFLAYQRFLEHFWSKISFEEFRSDEEFNGKARDKLKKCVARYWIFRGAPNRLAKEVIRLIVTNQNEIALEGYVELHSNISESQMISYKINTNFEFSENLHLMLSEEGKIAYKRILCTIENELRLSYCLALDVVVKLLLWFFPEYEVFYIVRVLLRQDCQRNTEGFKKYFVLRKEKTQEIIKTLTDQLFVRGGNRNLIEVTVTEMVKTMAVKYISPLYYPFVLINFIVEGTEAVLKTVLALFSLINYQDMATATQIKEQLKIQFNYIRFIHFFANVESGVDL